MTSAQPLRLGYVLKRFPRLSETFIVNEIAALERLGVSIDLFSLLEPIELIRHDIVNRLRAPVTYLPQKPLVQRLTVRHGLCAQTACVERRLGELLDQEPLRAQTVLAVQAAALAALARARGLAHLHAHFATDAATVARLGGRLAQLPYSFTAHAKDIYDAEVDTAALATKIREARFVVTVSEYNRRYLASLAGEPAASNIVRLYNGIDLERFRPDPSVAREPGLILAVGRLVPKKGFHDLIRACQLLRECQQPFRCVIVGEGEEHGALAGAIASLGLASHVTLAGAQPQERVARLMQTSTVFALPCVISQTGDRDGLPTVLLEALAMGLPAVSTDLAGIPEILEHGRSGLLVPPGDPTALAAALRTVLTDPGLRERLSRHGRLKAEEVFDVHRNVQQLEARFRACVKADAQPTALELCAEAPQG